MYLGNPDLGNIEPFKMPRTERCAKQLPGVMFCKSFAGHIGECRPYAANVPMLTREHSKVGMSPA